MEPGHTAYVHTKLKAKLESLENLKQNTIYRNCISKHLFFLASLSLLFSIPFSILIWKQRMFTDKILRQQDRIPRIKWRRIYPPFLNKLIRTLSCIFNAFSYYLHSFPRYLIFFLYLLPPFLYQPRLWNSTKAKNHSTNTNYSLVCVVALKYWYLFSYLPATNVTNIMGIVCNFLYYMY